MAERSCRMPYVSAEAPHELHGVHVSSGIIRDRVRSDCLTTRSEHPVARLRQSQHRTPPAIAAPTRWTSGAEDCGCAPQALETWKTTAFVMGGPRGPFVLGKANASAPGSRRTVTSTRKAEVQAYSQ
jgi:hypothetical protein